MNKLLSLLCCILLSTFVFGQDPKEIASVDIMKILEEGSCSGLNVCAEAEDSEDRYKCMQAAATSCRLDIDVEEILTATGKKKSVTTGVKSEEWMKLLKSISDSSKLVIGKTNSGASVSVVNKRTGKVMIRVLLTRINPTTFASAKATKFNKKEIWAYMKAKKPSYGSSVGLVSSVLKSCVISLSVK